MVDFKEFSRASSKDKNIIEWNLQYVGKADNILLSRIIDLSNVIFLNVDGINHLRGN